jgi:hypothetical protein
MDYLPISIAHLQEEKYAKMTMLTSEEKENAHCMQKILHIITEAIDQDDKTILERLRTFLAQDVVLTAPALADMGINAWEMEGIEQVIHQFGRIFVDLQLTTLSGSKQMVNVLARGPRVMYHNKIAGLAIMIQGVEFVPKTAFAQRHTVDFRSGYVKRWTIADDPAVLGDLAELFADI